MKFLLFKFYSREKNNRMGSRYEIRIGFSIRFDRFFKSYYPIGIEYKYRLKTTSIINRYTRYEKNAFIR